MNEKYLDLRLVKRFIDVAQSKSFSKVAREQRLTQPGVSKQIRQLEETLEVNLFEKKGKTSLPAKLTEAGLWLKNHAKSIVDAFDEIYPGMEQFRKLTQFEEVVSFRSIETAWKGGWLNAIRSRELKSIFKCFQKDGFKDVRGTSDSIEQQVASGKIDFGFVVWQSLRKGIKHFHLKPQSFTAILADNYDSLRAGKLDLRKVANEKWFISGERTRNCVAKYAKAYKKAGFELATDEDDAISEVIHGNGIAIIPNGSAKLPKGYLCRPVPGLFRQVTLIWTALPTPAHKAFLRYVKVNRAFTED